MQKISEVAPTHVDPLDASVRETKKDSLGPSSVLRLRAVIFTAAYAWRVVKFIRKNDIDVVHTNSLKADVIGGIAGRISGRFVLWHVRDRIAEDYLPPSVVWAFRKLCRYIPHFVIANSGATLKSLQMASDKPGAAIPSGVDMAARRSVVHDGTFSGTDPQRRNGATGYRQIALIGRICRWKGQDVFLRAAHAVRSQFADVRFIIVGAALFGEEQYEQEIRGLVASLGMNDCVTFTGFCPDVPH